MKRGSTKKKAVRLVRKINPAAEKRPEKQEIRLPAI